MARLPAGVYYLDEFPTIPAHPQCRCYGAPVTIRAVEAMLAELRGEAGIAVTGRPGMGDLDIADFAPDLIAPTTLGADGSAVAHLIPDGKGGVMFTPERQALHDAIVRSTLEGVPQSGRPAIYMLGGGPAAGKTTLLLSGQVDVPDTEKREAVLVNPDEMKVLLPEYVTMQAEGGQRQLDAAPFTHEESSYLAKRVRAAAIELQKDVVFDGVGVKYDDVIELARPDGYEIRGYYVMLQDPQVAVERSNARAAKTGRLVPAPYVLGKHKEVAQKFPDAAAKMDTIVMYDTTVNPPQLVAHKDRGGDLIVDNAEVYGRLQGIARGEPMPTSRVGMGDLDVAAFQPDFMAKTTSLGPGSAAPYLKPDGKGGWQFTPERQALHDSIVASFLKDVPVSADPTLHMLGGGPGAGKTTLLKSGLITVPDTDKREAVLVNPDEMKVLIPEYQAMQAAGGQMQLDAASFVHEESSYLAKRVRAAALETRRDAVLDGVGVNFDDIVSQAHPAGYKVLGHYVMLKDPQVAVERAEARAAKTGRSVPSSYILAKHQEVAQKFAAAAEALDGMELYDTGATPPKLVAHKAPGGELVVDDAATYRRLGAVARGEFSREPRPGMGDLDLAKFTPDLLATTHSGEWGSAARHLVQDGRGGMVFTAERQALHDSIVQSFLDDVPKSDDPTIYMLGGGPAAGKTTLLQSGLVKVPDTEKREAVLVNPDEVRVLIPEYQQMQAQGGQAQIDSAPVSHEEASYLSKRIRAAAVETGRDVVVDGVGVNYNDMIAMSSPSGYKVQGYYVMLQDPQVAVARAEARAAKTGRSVPAAYILAKHKEVAQKFPDAAEKLNSVILYDTSVTPPKLVAHRDPGDGALTIDDPKTYRRLEQIARGEPATAPALPTSKDWGTIRTRDQLAKALDELVAAGLVPQSHVDKRMQELRDGKRGTAATKKLLLADMKKGKYF